MECLDASIVVKWFKEDEDLREESLEILRQAGKKPGNYAASEWLVLELVRGLIKAGIDEEIIRSDYAVMKALSMRGMLTEVPVSIVTDLAKDLEINLKLYAVDAVHLATAIKTGSSVLWTEDEHFHKKSVKEYAAGYGLAIKGLDE